jgi:hypothetical protein
MWMFALVALASTTCCPYYGEVPKDFDGNLEYRMAVERLVLETPRYAEDFWIACKRDLLFYVNVFGWTLDPRLPGIKNVPFNTYPFQDEALLTFQAALGKQDVVCEKSRDQGASWMPLWVIDHAYRFFPQNAFLVVSRNESLVDDGENPDTLFSKLDHIEENLPWFLQVQNRGRRKLHIVNPDNGSTIDGASTTGNVGRGGRRTAVLIDEFAAFEVSDGYRALAATQQVSKCRIFPSTPQGSSNAFYDIAHPPSRMKKLRFHWSDHPVQARGLYTSKDGVLEILDTGFWDKATVADIRDEFPLIDMGDDGGATLARHSYPFVIDDKYKLRSPYRDHEGHRTPVDSIIAQELEIDFLGSGSPFFTPEEIQECIQKYAQPPVMVGSLIYDEMVGEPDRFVRGAQGDLKLWINVDAHGHVPHDRPYAIGVDVSAGSGASNSAVSIGDGKTGEKVGEYLTPRMRPEALAGYVAALGRFFADAHSREAKVIWEGQGPGTGFGPRLQELGYRNIYYHTTQDNPKPTNRAGWFSTANGKYMFLTEYGRAMAAGEFLNRSREAILEMREYVHTPAGGIAHSRSMSCLDPTGAKDRHGDIVMADTLLWHILKRIVQGGVSAADDKMAFPQTSFGERQQKRQKASQLRYCEHEYDCFEERSHHWVENRVA